MEKFELVKALEEIKKIVNGIPSSEVAPSDVPYTVAEWVAHWLYLYKKPIIKSSTFERYKLSLAAYIAPSLGEIPLNLLTADRVQEFYNSLLEQRLRTGTIKHVHAVLCPALAAAVEQGLITRNACERAVIPRTPRHEIRTLSEEEVAVMERFAKENPTTYNELFIVLLYTGMRLGELQAVRTGDLNSTYRTITISKTIKRRGDVMVITTPKTASSIRVIPLCEKALKILRLRGIHSQSGYLFETKDGLPLGYHNTRRAFNAFLKHCGLPKNITIHSLRHTFATRLLEKGANPKTVSELLGHSSVRITLDIYTHVSKGEKQRVIALFDEK